MAARVVVLAAGSGTRMRSRLPKALHAICGRPMIDWVLQAAAAADPRPPVVVVGRGSDQLRAHLSGRATIAEQPEPRGTGDALMAARPLLAGGDALLVLYGDVPLVRAETVRALLRRFGDGDADAVLLTARPGDPRGYGRIVRSASGAFRAVVEERDLGEARAAGPAALAPEVNAGACVFAPTPLWSALEGLEPDSAQHEVYLTRVPARLDRVATVEAEDPAEALGVNDRVQLAAAAAVARRRLLDLLMLGGVTVEDPAATWVDAGVEVGTDTVLRPATVLAGRTRLGRGCVVGPFAQLEDTETGDDCRIAAAHLVGCRLDAGVVVGPYNRVRPGSVLEAGSRLGAFTEVVRSRVGPGSAVPHLTYLGDTVVGRDVNIGAGTITANWDGAAKHATVVGDGARIGSHTVLVAPVAVGAGAHTGAGSVITKDVPPGALGMARARQRNLAGWAGRRPGPGSGRSRDNEAGGGPDPEADGSAGVEPG